MPLFYVVFWYLWSLISRLYPSLDHLRLWTSLSLRRSALLCRRRLHRLCLFFAIASHLLALFIVGRLLHPCRRDWPYFSVAFISTVLHRQMIFSSSPDLDHSVLLHHCLRRRSSPPPVFRSPLPLPPSPPYDCTGPPFIIASFGRLLSPVAIFGRLIFHFLCLGRPRTPFQGVYQEFFSKLSSQAQLLKVQGRT